MPTSPTPTRNAIDSERLARTLRQAAPYVSAYRGATFVLSFPSSLLGGDRGFELAGDFSVLAHLGIRLLLAPDTTSEIECALKAAGLWKKGEDGRAILDDKAFEIARQIEFSTQVELERQLSAASFQGPRIGNPRIHISSGNYITAQPIGRPRGLDHGWSGRVRNIDSQHIGRHLADDGVVVVPSLAYSSTGEALILDAFEVARESAIALRADKLVRLCPGLPALEGYPPLPLDIIPRAAEEAATKVDGPMARELQEAAHCCRRGVRRIHLLDGSRGESLLQELFTRDGIGILVTGEPYRLLRRAGTDDIAGILEITRPLQEQDILMARDHKHLELHIDSFHVAERDGAVIACAALYRHGDDIGEIASVATHADYKGIGIASRMLDHVESKAWQQGLTKLVLATREASQWFRERGYRKENWKNLPESLREKYQGRCSEALVQKPAPRGFLSPRLSPDRARQLHLRASGTASCGATPVGRGPGQRQNRPARQLSSGGCRRPAQAA